MIDEPDFARTNDVGKLVDHLFRHTAGKLTSTLTRILGTGQIDEAESIVQDAFIKACETWPYKGIPPNPAAWLTTVAKNLALDRLRKESTHRNKEREVVEWYGEAALGLDPFVGDAIDDLLRMMFLTCHPSLSKKSQIALTLKTSAGLSVPEISKALLTTDESVRKTITRAKKQIRELKLPFEFPAGQSLSDRIDSVLDVCYLIFNEGYSAFGGESLVRQDLVDEGIRLASLFLEGPLKDNPQTAKIKALLALMLLQSSRVPARQDENGAAVILEDQDRSKWDKKRLVIGLRFLEESTKTEVLSRYHLEARIAAAHSLAGGYKEADWTTIRHAYDRLLEMTGNPVVALNRAIAVSMETNVEAGLAELELLKREKALKNYHLLYATFADFYRKKGNGEKALENYRKALDLCENGTERAFLKMRIEELK